MTTYTITKLFTGGDLAGLTYDEVSSVKCEVGQTGGGPGFGSPWVVVAVVETESPAVRMARAIVAAS